MKKFIAPILALIVTVSAPLFVSAHPGHGGDDGFTIIHYFTQPVHMVVTIPMVLALAVYGVRSARRKTGNK